MSSPRRRRRAHLRSCGHEWSALRYIEKLAQAGEDPELSGADCVRIAGETTGNSIVGEALKKAEHHDLLLFRCELTDSFVDAARFDFIEEPGSKFGARVFSLG